MMSLWLRSITRLVRPQERMTIRASKTSRTPTKAAVAEYKIHKDEEWSSKKFSTYFDKYRIEMKENVSTIDIMKVFPRNTK